MKQSSELIVWIAIALLMGLAAFVLIAAGML